MMTARSFVLTMAVLCVCCAVGALGAGYTYPVAISGPVTTGGTGTIEVVGTMMVDRLGPLVKTNFLDYNLIYTSPNNPDNIVTPTNDGSFFITAPDIMATTAGLTINVHGSAHPVGSAFQLTGGTLDVLQSTIRFHGGDGDTPVQFLVNRITLDGQELSNVYLGTTSDVQVVLSSGSVWYTYDVAVSGPATVGGPGDVVVTGWIAVKKLGQLAAADIADWKLTISSPNAPDVVLVPGNSAVSLSGPDLTATASELNFNMRGSDNPSSSFFSIVDSLGTSAFYSMQFQGGDGRDAKRILHNQPIGATGDSSSMVLGSGEDVPVVVGNIPIRTPELTGAGVSIQGIDACAVLTWTSVPGLTYRVMANSNLMTDTWSPVTNVMAEGLSTTYTNTAPVAEAEFFCVEAGP